MRPVALALLLCWSLPARAQEVAVRVGNHPGFGRVVFDIPPGAGFGLVEEAGRALLVFTGSPTVAAPAMLPRNVLSLDASDGAATLAFRPGARVRASRMGQRVVVDAYDPVAAAPRQQAPRPLAVPVIPTVAPAAPPPANPTPAEAGAVPPGVQPAPAVPVQATPLPDTRAPSPVPASRPAPPDSLMLPVAADVGAAAFVRGSQAIIVLDARLDRGVIPAHAAVSEGANTTVLSMPLPPDAVPQLTRTAQGWTVTVATGPAKAAAPVDASVPGVFKLPNPGRAVTVLDPSTGQQLLVGTSRDAAGGGVLAIQRTPAHAVLPSSLGIVVEPFSDRVRLAAVQGGFWLEPSGTAPTAPPVALARLFDLPDLPVPAQLNRLQAQVLAAADAPPRARGPARLGVAQAMLALGMAAEAGSVLAALASEDPDLAARADVRALAGAAAALAGRLAEAGGLDDPRLDGAGEAGLWRGLRLAWQGREKEAAGVLLQSLPLVLSYPATLRDRLLPTVLEVAAQHGEGGAKAALAAVPNAPALDYARALQAERDGDTDKALAALDMLASSRNALAQVQASAHATELRLRTGAITPVQAADALDKQVLAWRGDGRELALRLRVAELRTMAGLWRPALDGLRDAASVAGDAAPVARRMEAVFRAMLAPDAPPVAPLDLATLAADYADQLPNGPDGVALRLLLASKLVTLDLPARAQAVVRPLVLAAQPGPVRGGLGATLAQSLLDSGDAAAAGVVLQQSQVDGLPQPVQDQRGLLLARVQAADGRTSAAVSTLAAIASPAADDLRARLLEQAGDKPGALAAVGDLARKLLPASGPLDAAMQDLVLRQASAAVQAGADKE